MDDPAIDIEALSKDQRLDLLERLWDSLRSDPASFGLSEGHRQELDGRLDRLDAEGPMGVPWEDVLQEMDDADLV